jgi:hypothetical protein
VGWRIAARRVIHTEKHIKYTEKHIKLKSFKGDGIVHGRGWSRVSNFEKHAKFMNYVFAMSFISWTLCRHCGDLDTINRAKAIIPGTYVSVKSGKEGASKSKNIGKPNTPSEIG